MALTSKHGRSRRPITFRDLIKSLRFVHRVIPCDRHRFRVLLHVRSSCILGDIEKLYTRIPITTEIPTVGSLFSINHTAHSFDAEASFGPTKKYHVLRSIVLTARKPINKSTPTYESALAYQPCTTLRNERHEHSMVADVYPPQLALNHV